MDNKIKEFKSLTFYKSELESLFGQIADRVGYQNKNGITQLNKELEKWLTPVFNTLFEAEFVPEESINAPAIDTSDKKKKLAIQLTSISTTTKVNDTLVQIYKNDYHKVYDSIFIVVLKLHYSKSTIDLNTFRSSTKFLYLNK